MFLNVENLNVEQLLEKQIELRQKLHQAHRMNMTGPAAQIQNMIEQIGIEIQSKSQIQALEKERERKIEEGKDPDDDVLNIG
jgi:predicted xylose isomerase-like sugar epimerase